MVVSFHELAERELNDGAKYYHLQQAGLGTAFIAEVRRSTEAICAYPEAGPVVRGDVRRRLCRRFPYSVLYTLRPDTVRVLAVMKYEAPAHVLGGTTMTSGPTSGCTRYRCAANRTSRHSPRIHHVIHSRS